jgi:hypothetical protein
VTRSSKRQPAPAHVPQPGSFRKRLIVAFVGFHLFAMLLFALPIDSPPTRLARTVVGPYMRAIGMTEVWDMFAPHPKEVNQFVRAIVITRSGEYKLYSFPRIEELSFLQRYQKERYRKFTESALCAECSGLWPDVERAVARRFADPVDPPDRILLVRFDSRIDPATGATGDDSAAKPTVVSQYTVRPEDLK